MTAKRLRSRWATDALPSVRYPKTDEFIHVLERVQEERYRPGFRKGARCKPFRRWETISGNP